MVIGLRMGQAENEKITATVSRLNREVRGLLESGYPAVWIEGELSNLARPASGPRSARMTSKRPLMGSTSKRFTTRILPLAWPPV